MFITDIIDKKRNNKVLNREEIEFAVNGYLKGSVAPEQMSALLMAIVINGMNKKETFYLTKTMQNSGKTYKFSYDVVDKHSSGGVGDSTTLVLLPVLSSLGVKVAKMSGKALGFTGGTIDKVSCFDGFNTNLTQKEFEAVISKWNGSIISQTDDIAVADKKIYALRDKCACVESIPLIASSIMSKKLASGSNTILLDVKCGEGAFMKTRKDAIKLAKTMVEIGKLDGKDIVAFVTDMNSPLSFGVGCAQEVYSVIKALKGENGDLLTLSKLLSAQLYSMANKVSLNEALFEVEKSLRSGIALKQLKNIVKAQGGSIKAIDEPETLLSAKVKTEMLYSGEKCFVSGINALTIAKVQRLLQVGASDKDKKLCGLLLNVKVGDEVKQGDILSTLYSFEKVDEGTKTLFMSAFEFSKKKPKNKKLLLKIVK